MQIPKDIIVMAYEIRFYMPDAPGARTATQVVNASWTPLYVVNDEAGRRRRSTPGTCGSSSPSAPSRRSAGVIVPPEAPVFGAQMCAWEQSEALELPNERLRLPAMMERIWNPATGKDYPDFARRLGVTDRLLDALLQL